MHQWREIAIQYGPLVWSVAYRILQDHEDAADCHQEVFVDAIRRCGHRRQTWADTKFAHALASVGTRKLPRLDGLERPSYKVQSSIAVGQSG